MSHCVPSWDVDDHNLVQNPNHRRQKAATLHGSSNSASSTLGVPSLDYEVAELTWKNGQVSMHGFGVPRVVNKPPVTTPAVAKYTWEKPRAAETLEAIVNQATLLPHRKTQTEVYSNDLVPWLSQQPPAIVSGVVSASATMTMDALVPSSNNNKSYEPQSHGPVSGAGGAALCSAGRVGSCSVENSGYADQRVVHDGGGGQSAPAHEWSSCRDGQSVSGSATFGMESSRQFTVETGDRELELGVKGLTSTSTASPENTNSGKRSLKSTSPDEHDSVCHSRPQNMIEEKKKGKGKSSISTKRSRAAAIHNQSERRRRDKINQKMKTLQKLVPNANKTDKASMLDEVIEYLKQLQAQVHMMSRMSMSPMMMPLAMQQQLQMAMMNPMGMGMGMNMGMGMGMGMPGAMDLNSIGINRSNIPGMSPVFHPSTFMQPTMPSWDVHNTSDRISNHNDQMAAFLACQSQPMTMEAYGRLAAMFQQMQNQPCYPAHKN